MILTALSFLFVMPTALASPTPPSPEQKAEYARWMASSTAWGILSTISTRKEATVTGAPFGNPYSFADVKGVPYFYASDLDASMIDLFTSKSPNPNPRATFATSEATLLSANGSAAIAQCKIGTALGDPENPPCARLVLSGVMSKVVPNSAEDTAAKAALFARHPSFKNYPKDHGFYVAKMSIDGIWMINFYGGAAIIKPDDYFKAALADSTSSGLVETAVSTAADTKRVHPLPSQKPQTARWMVSALNWGALSTLSTRSDGTTVGDPFGNPYSFADVDGVPYFYASSLDASMIDLFTAPTHNARASFTLSEASEHVSDFIHNQACKIGTYLGDPEDPPCARLQLSGIVSKVTQNSTEEAKAKAALFSRHPSFKDYPPSHDFYVAKLTIDGAWLIDMFGGAAIISPADYFKASSNELQKIMI
jgi:hypothetical protein